MTPRWGFYTAPVLVVQGVALCSHISPRWEIGLLLLRLIIRLGREVFQRGEQLRTGAAAAQPIEFGEHGEVNGA